MVATLEGGHRLQGLRTWFRSHGRQFYWRREPESAWAALVSETLLRRTRANQVDVRVRGLIVEFPTPESMATKEWPLVREALRPFGLEWRSRNLFDAAQMITDRFKGSVPLTFQELISLPGVGPYVASSVLALATGQDVVLTDTNSVRVAKRVHGLPEGKDDRRSIAVRTCLDRLMDGPRPIEDWWAVFDLAATLCQPSKPLCSECPIRPWCATGKSD